jgi:predicted AAA+ superfamily ATPase
MKQIRHCLGRTDIVKIITGIHNTGKTTFLKMICQELISQGIPEKNIFFYSGDEIQYLDSKVLEGQKIYDMLMGVIDHVEGAKHIFIDDFMLMNDGDRCIQLLLAHHDIDLYITGSHIQILNGFYDRFLPKWQGHTYQEVELRPFSFLEYRDMEREKDPTISDQLIFDEYLMKKKLFETLAGVDSRNAEIVMRNIMHLKLISQGYHVISKDQDEKNIDMIAQREDLLIGVKVCQHLSTPYMIKTQLAAFDEVIKRGITCYLISMEHEEGDFGKVIHKSLQEILFMEDL